MIASKGQLLKIIDRQLLADIDREMFFWNRTRLTDLLSIYIKQDAERLSDAYFR